MALTRPRAHQLLGTSAKSAVRVVSESNITLSGGTPATVDGVSLTLDDRILVTGQSTASENGLYRCTVVGAGSNGTWVRSRDGSQQGTIVAGMTCMVTEGSTNADTLWKLTTDGAITLDTTDLTFEKHTEVVYGPPGGSDTQVQFNDSGSYGGDAGLTYNKTTDSLTITGNLTVGGTDSVSGFTLDNAGDLLIVGTDGTSIDSSALLNIDTGNGRLGIGTASPARTLHLVGDTQFEGSMRIDQYHTSADGPDVLLHKARGTPGTPLVNVAGDELGKFVFYTHNGTSFLQRAIIRSAATLDGAEHGGTLEFLTGDNADPSTRLTIDENGNVTFADGTTDVDIASHDGTNGLKLGGTLVTATATELNLLDGVTGLTLGDANEILIVGTGGTAITSTSVLSIDDTNNYIGINQTSPEVTLHMTGEASQSAQIRMEQMADTADAPDIRTRKSRGTAAAPTKNNAGDFIYRQNHERYNGTSWTTVGQVAVDTDDTNADRFVMTFAVSEDGTSIDAANNQLQIDGNDSGAITFNQAYKFPTSDGSANQVLQTDGSGALSFATVNTSAIDNVVEDTTPQLGGQLDVNGNAIGDGTLELLKFSETASAVNEFTIANAATTNGPTLSATGDDTNIDINITPKGTGEVVIGAGNLNYGGTAITATGAELNYVDGVTSAIQTQIDAKAPTASPTFTGTLTYATLNDGTTDLTSTVAELNYVDGMFDNTTANAVPSINSSNNGFVDSGMIYNSATTSLGIGVASANDIDARLHIVGTGTANTGETMFKVNNSNDHDRIEFIDEGISSGMPSALRNIGASLGIGIISESGAVKLFSGGNTTSDLVLEASDTGIQFNGAYRFPTSDGSANQVLQTDGSGALTFVDQSGGGSLSNIVEDTTPQLGGDLDLNSSDITGTGDVNITGTGTFTSLTVAGDILNGQSDGVGNIGSSSVGFDTVHAKATSAQYADLAERYITDKEYESGTVVVIGGDNEATECTAVNDHAVLGIISTDPAVKMNQSINGQDIALTGRVPCKVVGKVNRGELLVTSSTPGHAEVRQGEYVPGTIIGKALDSKTTEDPGVIEVAVGRF